MAELKLLEIYSRCTVNNGDYYVAGQPFILPRYLFICF